MGVLRDLLAGTRRHVASAAHKARARSAHSQRAHSPHAGSPRADPAARIQAVVDLIDTLADPVPVPPAAPDAVGEWLPIAADRATGDQRPIAHTLMASWQHLHWVTGYDNEPPSATLDAFRAGYSYTLLASPDNPGGSGGGQAPYRSDDMLLGFTIQGPGLLYPVHSHLAVEVYGVISGTARWYEPDGTWPERPPGSVIVNEAHRTHAMATGKEPMLTWVAWVTDPCSVPVMHPEHTWPLLDPQPT